MSSHAIGTQKGKARYAQPQVKRAPPAGDIERPLPRNDDAERSVLGAILLNISNPNSALEKASAIINGGDFFADSHRRIFSQMIQLGEAQQAIDLVTLTDQLRRKGELDACGGPAYVAQLVDGVPRVSNLEHYARIIKEKSLLRSLIYASHTIQQSALDAGDEARDILERAFTMVGALREMASPPAPFVAPTIAELLEQAPAKPEYLVNGLIYKGNVIATLGKIKAGKTTFMLKAIEAILLGEPFLKLETNRTPVLYVTEQGKESFLAQVQRAQLKEESMRELRLITHYDLIGMDWVGRARLIGQQAVACNAGLIVTDTFSRIALVKEENDAGEMQAAVDVLQNFTPREATLNLCQHERKSGGDIEDAGRGTSALGGCADVLLRISRIGGGQDRRRDIQTLSRPWTAFEEAQRIELHEDGFYRLLGSASGSTGRDLEQQISVLWPGTHLTLEEIIERTGASRSNVQRALDNLIKDGIVCATGEGKRGDPKRYRGVEP